MKPIRTRSNLQLIETLCLLCEQLIRLVRKMSLRLAELGDIALGEEIAAANEQYRALIGSGETPDEFDREEEDLE